MEDRMNSEKSTFVTIDLLGHNLRIAQDPNSQHLGKTVWDASMVLAKYLERNANKGEFSRKKLAGKRALELGAGCGLAGMGLCLLGCDVVTTDQKEVLPMLQQNIDWNVSRSVISASDHALHGPVGEVTVAELDWGNEEHIKAVSPPFDLVVAADVLYAEHLVEPLLRTIAAVTGPRTTALISYELRSHSVHATFLEQSSRLFSVRKIPHTKMHPTFQHPSIDIYALKKLPQGPSRRSRADTNSDCLSVDQDCSPSQGENAASTFADRKSAGDIDTDSSVLSSLPDTPSDHPLVSRSNEITDCVELANGKVHKNAVQVKVSIESAKADSEATWSSRRAGVEAARLLAGINIDKQTLESSQTV